MILPVSTSIGYTKNSKQNTAFKGGRLNVITYSLNRWKKVNTQELRDCLQLTKEDVKQEMAKGINNPLPEINKPLKRHKAGFMFRLAKKFSEEIFAKENVNIQGKRQLVYNIYDKVKYPSDFEKHMVAGTNYSLEQLDKLFDLINQKPYLKSFSEKLMNLYSKKFYGGMSYDLLMHYLSKPNAQDLNKNFKKYSAQIEKSIKNYMDAKSNIL